MLWWQEERINPDTIIQFFQECTEYTKKLLEMTPDLRQSKFNHHLPKIQHPFNPIGAVIHSTNTETVSETLRLIARNVYGTHFIITQKAPTISLGALMREMPSVILMPMGWEEAVPHSAYMSKRSWGIDLRNIGRLRPWYKDNQTVPPIYPGEENPRMFKFNDPIDTDSMSFHWRKNMWREEFDGYSNYINGMYYESPNSNQVLALAALLHILNQYNEIDEEYIVQSNCVRGFRCPIPSLPMYHLRNYAIDANEKHLRYIKDKFIVEPYTTEFNIENIDEVFINENLTMNRWRSALDDGELDFVLSGPDVSLGLKDREALFHLGYSQADPGLALRMFAMNCGVHQDYFTDAIGQIAKKTKIFEGEQ